MISENTPIVTLGMPVYNGSKFLTEAIISIRKQTFERWVLLISDDCSTDDSLEIIDSFASTDSRIIVYRQPQNLGHLENFQFVLNACRTPYFMWHCQDDWIAPTYLECLLSVFASSSGCALACGGSKRVAIDGTVLKYKEFPNLQNMSRANRVRLLLCRSDATRIFGLFATDILRGGVFTNALRVGYVWGWDPLALLPLIVSDRIRGTNETSFYWRDTGLSSEKYKPNTLGKELAFLLRWLRYHVWVLWTADLSVGEKVICIPAMMRHLLERSGVSPYKKYVRPLLRSIRRQERKRT